MPVFAGAAVEVATATTPTAASGLEFNFQRARWREARAIVHEHAFTVKGRRLEFNVDAILKELPSGWSVNEVGRESLAVGGFGGGDGEERFHGVDRRLG
jgi:hypothetical protein